MNESMVAPELRPEAPPPPFEAPNRDAMTADAAAVLSWLQSSATWTLLDQTVTPLLGRSPQQIVSALFSAVIELPDEELFTLALLVTERSATYASPRPIPPMPLGDEERDALAALRGAVAGAFGL